jgi:hypothetical protein
MCKKDEELSREMCKKDEELNRKMRKKDEELSREMFLNTNSIALRNETLFENACECE